MEQNISFECTVNSAGGDGENPRRDVTNGGGCRAVIPTGGDDGDAVGDSVEGADGDGVDQVVGGIAADGEGDDVDAVGDGGVEGDENIGIEALVVTVNGGPAYLVVGDASPWRAPLGRAVAGAEDARSLHHIAAGGR